MESSPTASTSPFSPFAEPVRAISRICSTSWSERSCRETYTHRCGKVLAADHARTARRSKGATTRNLRITPRLYVYLRGRVLDASLNRSRARVASAWRPSLRYVCPSRYSASANCGSNCAARSSHRRLSSYFSSRTSAFPRRGRIAGGGLGGELKRLFVLIAAQEEIGEIGVRPIVRRVILLHQFQRFKEAAQGVGVTIQRVVTDSEVVPGLCSNADRSAPRFPAVRQPPDTGSASRRAVPARRAPRDSSARAPRLLERTAPCRSPRREGSRVTVTAGCVMECPPYDVPESPYGQKTRSA